MLLLRTVIRIHMVRIRFVVSMGKECAIQIDVVAWQVLLFVVPFGGYCYLCSCRCFKQNKTLDHHAVGSCGTWVTYMNRSFWYWTRLLHVPQVWTFLTYCSPCEEGLWIFKCSIEVIKWCPLSKICRLRLCLGCSGTNKSRLEPRRFQHRIWRRMIPSFGIIVLVQVHTRSTKLRAIWFCLYRVVVAATFKLGLSPSRLVLPEVTRDQQQPAT